LNMIPEDEDVNLYVEYGIESGVYTDETDPIVLSADEPMDVVIDGLSPNTQYFYRVRYRAVADGAGEFNVRDEHSFQTPRAKGEEFVFTMSTDSHYMPGVSGAMGTLDRYRITVENVEDDQPDIHFDLGDTFMTNNAANQDAVDDRYEFQRDFFGQFGHSTPTFLSIGNHENEEGWNFDDVFSLAYASIR